MVRKLVNLLLASSWILLACVLDAILRNSRPVNLYAELQGIAILSGWLMGTALKYAVKSATIGFGIGMMSMVFCLAISCSQDPLANVALIALYTPWFACSFFATRFYLRLFPSHVYLLDIE